MILLLLLIIPALTALVSLTVSNRWIVAWANTVGAALTFLVGISLSLSIFLKGPITALNGQLYVDALSAFEILVSVTIGLGVVLYSRGYMEYELLNGHFHFRKLQHYYAFVNVFWFVFLLVCMANNLGIVWIAIEGTTLATAPLVAFYNRETSIEAAWKYFILCTVGLSLALMGLILLYYSATRLTVAGGPSLNWSQLAQIAPHLDANVLKLAFVFTLIGYGTKVGLAPMHTWLPDAHSEAPSPVSALLSGMLLNGAMYGLIRVHSLVVRNLGPGLSNRLLLFFGLASLCIAVPFILRQKDFKRLLAYSSIEHMGIIAVGLGLGTPLSTFGALLHTLYHSLVKSTMFMAVGNVLLKYKTREMAQVNGVLKTLPVSGPVMLLGAFAIAGAPPFGLFLSEFTILNAGFSSGQYVPTVIMLIALILIFIGVARHFSLMAFGNRPDERLIGEESVWNWAPLLVLITLAGGLGIYLPPFLVNALHQIVAIVQGTP